MELIGLVIFAALFAYSGFNHIKNHSAMVGYTKMSLGTTPGAEQLAYLGGWPTGVFLLAFAIGTVINESSVFAYGLAAFLAVTWLLFHRNLKDPANAKHFSLIGAALYIAANVV